MSFEVAELERRLANLIRVGVVERLDDAGARVVVRCGGLTTDWLPWLTTRAGADRTWWAPEPGEQVLVLAPCGDTAQAVVLPALYQEAHAAPAAARTVHRTVYADGASVEYDRAAGALSVAGVRSVSVQAAGAVTVHAQSVTIDAPQTTCTGQLTVQGLLTYQAGMRGSGSAGGGAAVITGDVIADGVSLKTHTHGGVQSGGARTGGPG